jgi:hypothetical protein
MKDAVRAFYQKAIYPPDGGSFNPTAVFTGEQIAGYWNPEKEVRWRSAAIEPLDARVWLGKGGAQVWYTTAWVRADVATPLTFIVHSMPQSQVRLALDDHQIFDGVATVEVGNAWLTAMTQATLAPGWHRVQMRTFDWGYGPSRVGLALDAPLERLWGLSCSGHPPAAQ